MFQPIRARAKENYFVKKKIVVIRYSSLVVSTNHKRIFAFQKVVNDETPISIFTLETPKIAAS